MNKHNDFIASDNEPLRLATSFRPVRARLRKVRLDCFVPVVSSASWKLGRFGPLDLMVERLNRRSNIVPIESGVGLLKSFGLSRKGWCHDIHFSLLVPMITGVGEQYRNGEATTDSVLADASHFAIVSLPHSPFKLNYERGMEKGMGMSALVDAQR
jgi:hypothetical protein